MKSSAASLVLLGMLLGPHGLAAAEGSPANPRAASSVTSVRTDLSAAACDKVADKSDPNETPFLRCPGVAGYSLLVRSVESGRKSIDVVDPAQRVFPLNYQEVVTRHMSTVAPSAEWRVSIKDGRRHPVALIVQVQSREDGRRPERVSATYIAVAKITATGVCVTDRIPLQGSSSAQVRRLADRAHTRTCLAPRPVGRRERPTR